MARRSSPALEALEADVALAKDVPEDVLALGRRAAEIRDDLRFLLRADDPGYVYFLETRGRGIVPARVADRRLGDRSASCCSIAWTRPS